MLPPTTQRVSEQTCDAINLQIRRETEQRIEQYRNASWHQIDARLKELDREWDTERLLEANAATLAFTGCVLAATTNRRWVFLPMAVTAFLFQHAVHGWCPPLPVIRKLGFRTASEIHRERIALKVLRGDFDALRNREQSAEAIELLHAVES